jgi:hypothetical protein
MKTLNVSITGLTPLSDSETMNVSGGSFAYDVGRVLRFIGIASSNQVYGVGLACIDWCITSALNEQ